MVTKPKKSTLQTKLRFSLGVGLILGLFAVTCGPKSSQVSNSSGGSFVPCAEKPTTQRNLECDGDFVDTNPPYTFAFPATARLKGEFNVELVVNEVGATVYYTTDGTSPATDSTVYSGPFAIDGPTTVRYFGVDVDANFEQPRIEDYKIDSPVDLNFDDITSHFVNEAGLSLISFRAQAGAVVTIEFNGNENKGSGATLVTATATGSGQSVSVRGEDMIAGENKLFLFAEAGGDLAYGSFYLVRDDQEAFVQANPDAGSFAGTTNLALETIEPATIYYNITDDDSEPEDPTTTSTVYSDPISLVEATDDVVIYQIKYFSVDLAGNVSDIAYKTFTIDTEAPVISPEDSSGLVDNGSGIDPYVLAGSPIVTYVSDEMETRMDWDSEEDCTYVIEVGGNAQGEGTELEAGSCEAFTTQSFVFTSDLLTYGENFVNLYATDVVGNVSTTTWVIFLDEQARTPVLLAPLLGWNEKDASTVDLSWSDMTSSEDDRDESGILRYDLEYDTNIDFTSATSLQIFGNSHTLSLADDRYYWRVRSVDEVFNQSDWSGIRHFYAGVASSDVQSDESEDIVIGAPGYNLDQGRAYLFTGNATTPPYDTTVYQIFEGESTDHRFGHVVAITEDINGGGKADILISAIGYGSSQGRVYIFYGENIVCGVPPCTTSASAADVIITGDNGGDEFGTSMAFAGDFNRDGLGDIIIGATSDTGTFTNSGLAFMFFGGSLSANMNASSADLIFQGQAGNQAFGSCVSNAGDINSDGVTDLMIGAEAGDSLQGSATGIVYVYFGSQNPDTDNDTFLMGSDIAGSKFGGTCQRAFDTNLDGYEDMFVGAPEDPTFGASYGKAYVFRGGESILTVPEQQFNSGGAGGNFGTAIAPVNYDTDAYPDFLISAQGIGDSYHYTFNSGDDKFDAGNVFSGSGGQGIGLWGDLNSAGKDYFVIGDPSYNSDDGRAAIFYESTTATACMSSGGITACGGETLLSDEEFGYSVSVRP